MRAGDLVPLSAANRFAFVVDAREHRRERGILRHQRDELIREAAGHRRQLRRRLLAGHVPQGSGTPAPHHDGIVQRANLRRLRGAR